MDFKSTLLTTLTDSIPELKEKVQAGAVDAKTPAPFATFSIPEEKPLRTLSGIAGYETTFESAGYDQRFAGAESLKRKVIKALDNRIIKSVRCQYRSSQTDYFADYDLHCITLTFKIL